MDFYDATTLMRLVQAVENDPYVSSGAGEALADKVREFIEDEAEMGGWYTELMNAIGEGEITDPLADFTVGRFRVHLVQEGERYGAGGGFVYGKALSNDCQLYGHGLPLVEFYDVSQDPAKFPEGQFVSRYFMSTLLGMDSIGDSIGEMSAFGLDGGVPDATKGMEEAGYLSMMDYSSPVKEGELYSILCGDLVAVGFDFETGENRDLSADEMSRVADYFTEVSKPGSGIEEVIAIRMGQRREEARSEDGRVTLKGEAQASRAASEKLAEGRDTGSPAREDPSIV